MSIRVIFAGTPLFAARALATIISAGFDVPLVLTQPDRASGRGMKLTPSAVKQTALTHSIEVAQPISLRLNGKYPHEAQVAHERIQAVGADVMVVAAYGLILPEAILQLPRYGCVNIHASLLPRWRGAAPIHRAIEAGDAKTGITLMQMDAGLDTGAMVAVQACPILPTDTGGTLHDKLSDLGANMVVDYLHQLAQGVAPAPIAQPECGITYAEKISKTEATMDWHSSAVVLARKIRAFDPALGCVARLHDEVVKIWAGEALTSSDDGDNAVGTVQSVGKHGVVVACGQGVLRITEMQKAGGKRGAAYQVAQALNVSVGDVLI